MTAPDFIWAWAVGIQPPEGAAGLWRSDRVPAMRPETPQYVRRDPAVLAALPEVQALVAAAVEEADKLGYHCVGCGHLCGDPDKDLALLRKAGALSCCPERKMEPLSEAIRALIRPDAMSALSLAPGDRCSPLARAMESR